MAASPDRRLTVRPADAADAAFLGCMLQAAAYWRPGAQPPPLAEVLADPHLAVYLEGWPRRGDRGVVAERDGRAVGAAWYRLCDEARHGYGYVDPATPEVSVAVEESHRGHGVGRALLTALMAQAERDGHPALSLSVERANPALRLYTALGFTSVGPEGGSVTMIARIAPFRSDGGRHP